MKKAVTLLLVASLVVFPAYTSFAGNTFFQKSVGLWTVFGIEKDGKQILNNVCFSKSVWDNGSYFALIQDVESGEMMIEISNTKWNITDTPGTTGDLTMYLTNKTETQSTVATFEVVDPTLLRVRQVDIEYFLTLFSKFSALEIIPPGNLPKIGLSLEGSAKSIGLMVQCMEKEKTLESSPRNPKNNPEAPRKQQTIVDPTKPSQDT